jgi:hypothetical protein
MRRRLWNVFLIAVFAITPLFGQESRPQVKKMSKAELATFLHDLAHDIPNWQTRVNQYRDKLDTRYEYDAMLHNTLGALEIQLVSIQADLKRLQQGEILMGDVSLESGLEDLTWNLREIENVLITYIEDYTSPTLREYAKPWLQAVKDVEREAGRYFPRFLWHTLAAAHEADVTLAHGCGKGSHPR